MRRRFERFAITISENDYQRLVGTFCNMVTCTRRELGDVLEFDCGERSVPPYRDKDDLIQQILERLVTRKSPTATR